MRNETVLRSLMVALMLATSAVACAPLSGKETAGEYVDDVTISTKVRTGIIRELGLEGIGVETMQGVVQLSGFVESAAIKTRAGEIAEDVSGVKDVRNNLIVR